MVHASLYALDGFLRHRADCARRLLFFPEYRRPIFARKLPEIFHAGLFKNDPELVLVRILDYIFLTLGCLPNGLSFNKNEAQAAVATIDHRSIVDQSFVISVRIPWHLW